jgi:hypothetical protein
VQSFELAKLHRLFASLRMTIRFLLERPTAIS